MARLDPAALHAGRPAVRCTGRSSWPSSPPPCWPTTWPAARRRRRTASCSRGPPRAGTARRPAAGCALDDTGQPVYGPRDAIDLAKVAALGGRSGWPAARRGRRSWPGPGGGRGRASRSAPRSRCAGSPASSARLRAEQLVAQALAGMLDVRNEPAASPAGFPFKVARARPARSPTTRSTRPGPGCAISATCGCPTSARAAASAIAARPSPSACYQRKGGDAPRARPGAGACATGCWPPSVSRQRTAAGRRAAAAHPGPGSRLPPRARGQRRSRLRRRGRGRVPAQAHPGTGAPVACPACWNR